jgi:signal transduction histidine kinase
MLAQLRHGPVKDFETELVKKSGETVPVSVSCHYYTDEAGAPAGVEGIIRDITERKGAQEALRAEHAQLAQRVEIRTAELSALNAELTRALASRDEFLAAMSHELRTPLTAILGQADMLRSELSGPLNERQLWQADTIYTSGQHLLQLINDVLDLARLMGGRLELDLSPVLLDELCQSCLRSSQREADKKHQTLRYLPAPEVPIVYADGGRVRQMLNNLLSNAIKFTPEGGEAGLEVQSDAGRQVVHLTVWDHGIGIAATDLPRLFQNFVQLDSRLTRDYEGTGLGLALVKRLAEIHGGEVSVTSTPNQGSRFTLTLPWKPA